MTDSMKVTSLSASLLQKSAAVDSVCQIALNRKLSFKLEKWSEYRRRAKAKLHKKKSHKMRPACTVL